MKKYSRRALLLTAGGAAGYAVSSKFQSKLPSLAGMANPDSKINSTTSLNDASELSATNIHKHITLSDDYDTALHASIRSALQESKQRGIPFNVGAARHSMGGQAIPREGPS